jgi:NADH dehydrogenase/NADH:ubiquinone oxidoreductase subunit G
MKTFDMLIDGKAIRAREGQTVLEAARQAGIEIPTLCYSDETEHLGGCRICSVQIEVNGRKNVVTSCSYPAEDGLKVTTNSPKIRKMRKTILELAAVNSGPNVAGDFFSLAKEYGADLTRFSSLVAGEGRSCILCGLCVNRCMDATHDGAIGFVGRGVHKRVVRFPESAQTCANCNYCGNICPTGRIKQGGPDPPFPTVGDVLSGRQ